MCFVDDLTKAKWFASSAFKTAYQNCSEDAPMEKLSFKAQSAKPKF
jgi:hypothetical protein